MNSKEGCPRCNGDKGSMPVCKVCWGQLSIESRLQFLRKSEESSSDVLHLYGVEMGELMVERLLFLIAGCLLLGGCNTRPTAGQAFRQFAFASVKEVSSAAVREDATPLVTSAVETAPVDGPATAWASHADSPLVQQLRTPMVAPASQATPVSRSPKGTLRNSSWQSPPEPVCPVKVIILCPAPWLPPPPMFMPVWGPPPPWCYPY